uniref:Uncharacterized protein n=1 Tax=Daphnia galeata TaxID=27404 RepID=A0A8J2RVP3_9CRUS|nr:unnamed protein product [Daphnia galeata]
MASRRNRRECQLQASFLNFANEVDGLSSSDMDDNESIVSTSPVENFSTQEESDCCSVGPRPSTPLESDTHSSVSSQFTETEVSQDASLEAERRKLASWQVENHIPHIQCDKLLRILKPYHPELPKCTKTLVQTDQNKLQLLEVPPGYYKHFGIRNGLVKVFEMLSVGQTIRGVLPIFVGIDDLKLHNSSTSQFTAIVGFIPSYPDSPPFEIGVSHAYSKAQSSNVL